MTDAINNADTATRTQYEVAGHDAETMANLAMKTATEANRGRVEIGAEMLNVFNTAVQVQGRRVRWSAQDFRTFMIALAAVDSIGAGAVASAETARVDAEVRNVLGTLEKQDRHIEETEAEQEREIKARENQRNADLFDTRASIDPRFDSPKL